MKAIEQPYKLTKKQQLLLELVAKSNLVNIFYLTGGTALSAFYLKHRFSEDLDFFSEQEFDQLEITTFFKKNQKQLGYSSIDIQTSFNRFLVFSEKWKDRNLVTFKKEEECSRTNLWISMKTRLSRIQHH